MAQELNNITINNDMGTISINKSVFVSIAEIVCQDEEGCTLINSNFKKGINCYLDKNGLLKLCCEIKVDFGHNADRLARQLQSKVASSIKQMTDIEADQVDIVVVGFQVPKK